MRLTIAGIHQHGGMRHVIFIVTRRTPRPRHGWCSHHWSIAPMQCHGLATAGRSWIKYTSTADKTYSSHIFRTSACW